ncbi:MAG: hypothetical protein ACRDZ7_17900 [Acidimicrobiia bacterium]
MLSSLVPLLVVVGVLCWVVLPAVILVAAAVGSRRAPDGPVWFRPCKASDPADPCWVTEDDEYCLEHEGLRPRPPGPPGTAPGIEIFIT